MMTLEEWIEKNAQKLSEDIKTHIDVLTDYGFKVDELHRCIMISIRYRMEDSK